MKDKLDWRQHGPDLTSQERAARIAWFLAKGEGLSIERIRWLTGLSPSGVSRMMTQLARVLPILKVSGSWQASSLASD